MTKFVSQKNPVSVASLKRKPLGAVVVRMSGYEDVKFVRVSGGWKRQRIDVTGEKPTVVTSADVARECNTAMGCRESWAKVY